MADGRKFPTKRSSNEPVPSKLPSKLPKSDVSTVLASVSTPFMEEKDCRFWPPNEVISDFDTLKQKIKLVEGFIKIRHRHVLMTKSLKAALIHIIDDLEAELQNGADKRRKVLIYYGVLKIGKSVAAQVLESYLGKVYGTTWFGCFRHECKASDTEATVNAMIKPPVHVPNVPDPIASNVLIFDQVNCDIIDPSSLLSVCEGREFPIIMFTSGHFVPSGDWIQCPSKVKVETIHMTVTIEEGVRLTNQSELAVTQLLETFHTVGGLLKMCVAENTIEAKKESGMVDYTIPALSQLVPIVWHECYTLIRQHSFEEAIQLKDFRMTINDMESFQLFMQDKKDYNDQSFNSLWTQIIPFNTKDETPGDQRTKDETPGDQPTFKFFPFTDTGFEISPVEQERFYNYCKNLNMGDRAQLENARAVFETSTGSLKGLCFEMIVFLYCRVNDCGLRPTDLLTDKVKFIQICEAYDCKQLVDQLFCKNDCPRALCHDVNIWFSLDVLGKPKFPGFDFVLVSGRANHANHSFDLGLMHLIQATVSLASKSGEKKSIMVREFNKFLNELYRRKCIRSISEDWNKVACCFYLPYIRTIDEVGSVKLELKREHKEELRLISKNRPKEIVRASVSYTDPEVLRG